jgi:hypothetical protein
VWPAVVVAICLQGIKLVSPGTAIAVLAEAAFGSALYVALFVLAIGRRDRGEISPNSWDSWDAAIDWFRFREVMKASSWRRARVPGSTVQPATSRNASSKPGA